jgi:16S rRNA (uracil1498-N3)-methyltransferase
MNAHEFALYTDLVSTWVKHHALNQTITLEEPELVHRVGTVLRFTAGDTLIFFDSWYHIKARIQKIISKKSVTLELMSAERNKLLKPQILWALPVLKREAFEAALYSLCELGATEIQPLYTAKTQKSWGTAKDILRSTNILKAAAEQSKQFVVPRLLPVKSLDAWLEVYDHTTCHSIFLDATGCTIADCIQGLDHKQPRQLCVLSGPEGDLTQSEKELLKRFNFIFCRLTPTILRAEQAIAVGLGILRSFLDNK